MLDEIGVWRNRIVANFPDIDPDKIKEAFNEGLAAYRNPETRYKFHNPYHDQKGVLVNESLSEMECLDYAFGSGWSAGVFDRKQKCERCTYEFVPRGENPPKVCPKCKSPYWSKPRKSR